MWKTSLTATGVSNALFGTIWGQKQTSQSAVQHDRDFYFSSNTLYIFSSGNPASYYGTLAAITTAAGQLIYINGKSWLQFQHISLTWFDGFGVNVTGASDHLVFANMEANGMVPAVTLPHGFYVNANSPGDIQFVNDEVRWSDTAWGQGNDRNLVARFTSRTFSVPRLGRSQDYYLRQYDAAFNYSRYTTALHVDYPYS